MATKVAVIGGGYGGVAVAKALDEFAEVSLIEPRETFVHNVASLRAVVNPGWIERIFLPYDHLLSRGRVVRDRAAEVGAGGVTLASGERIEVDVIILATGSRYPYPAKIDLEDVAEATAKLLATHQALADSERVLLLGAGPVGLELAGEITAVWPKKSVTIVDPGDDILPGPYPHELRVELKRQLDRLGVTLLLGTSLSEAPPSAPGARFTFTATIDDGTTATADIWFRCHGVEPVTDYLAADLAAARRSDGYLEVTDQLSLPGYPHVFAIGDITSVPEAKKAQAALAHAKVVAANVSSLLRDEGDPVDYQPEAPAISVPLGPSSGASYAAHAGLLDAETTARIKGRDLMIPTFAQLLGLSESALAPQGQATT